jgi:putative SOS response-associated peptidase YedK
VCGRFVASSTRDLLVDWFGIEQVDDDAPLPPSYNVAPTDDVYTVASSDEGRRRLRVTPWGLVAGDGDATDQRAGGDLGGTAGVPGRVRAAPTSTSCSRSSRRHSTHRS